MFRKTLLIIFLLLFSPLHGVFAVGTVELYGSACTGGPWGNCTNLFASDGNFSSFNESYPNPNNPYMTIGGFGNFGIPSNATITDVEVEITGYTSNNSNGRQLWIELSKDNGNTWQTNSVANDLMWINPPTSSTLHTYITNSNSTNFNNYHWQYSDFNNTNQLLVKVGSYNNQQTTFYVDYLKLHIRYDIPNSWLHVVSATASPSAQFVSLNLEGTTATVSSTMQCTVSLLEQCTRQGYASKTSDTAIAHILLDGLNTSTTTNDLGGGYYKAFGWGGTDNSWVANNVHVPYNPNFECSYPYSIICSDNHELAYIDDYSRNNTLIATPPANLTNTSLTEPEPTNPLSWVVWKGRQTLIDLFIPHDNLIMQQKDYISQLVQTKAPIAYGNAVLALNWTSSQNSTATPTIHIALAHTEGGVIPDINWSAPTFFVTAMATLRGALQVVLWMSFVLYIIIRVRGMFV
jgi:hypothetical protein